VDVRRVRNDQVELALLGVTLPCYPELPSGRVAVREGAQAPAGVVDAIARLAVRVGAEPELPAPVALRLGFVRLEVESVAMLEADRPLVNGRQARPACRGREDRQRHPMAEASRRRRPAFAHAGMVLRALALGKRRRDLSRKAA
jgi:hypothetical protein